MFYANVSAALSDAKTLESNIGLAKAYYESLRGQDEQIPSAIRYVGAKCSNVEGYHAAELEELAAKLSSRSQDK